MFKKLKDRFTTKEPVMKQDVYNANLYRQDAVNAGEAPRSNELDYINIPELLHQKAFNPRTPSHQRLWVEYNGWASANVEKVAETICSEGLELFILDAGEEEPSEGAVPDTNLMEFWRDIQGDNLLRKMIISTRTYGSAIYVPIIRTLKPSWDITPNWRVYSWEHFQAIKVDDNGFPMQVVIKNKPLSKGIVGMLSGKSLESYTKEYNYQQYVWCDPFMSDDFFGMPVNTKVFDDLIDHLMTQESMKTFDQRYGNGFFVLGLPLDTSDSKLREYESAIKKVSVNKGIAVLQSKEQPVTVDWQNMGGAQVDFISHLDKLESNIAVGMGFPLRWLRGDQEGAMESGGKDMLQVSARLKTIFSAYKQFITEVLLFHHLLADKNRLYIKHKYAMPLSEAEKIAIDQMRVSTIAQKTWLTLDEQRLEDGYAPLTDGNIPIASMNKSIFDFNLNQKEEEKAVADDNELEEDGNLTNQKLDYLMLKQDAMAITDNIATSEGYVLTPGELQYNDSKLKDWRPYSELKDWYDKPTPKELHLGVLPNDSHDSPILNEILLNDSVGKVQVTGIDEKGVKAKFTIDLQKVDEKLGEKNWIREYITKHQSLPVSVALWSKDVVVNNKRMNTNLDIRSVVLTRRPRNKETQIEL